MTNTPSLLALAMAGLLVRGLTTAAETSVTPAGNLFYCDPVKGSPDGDGSAARPWRSLQEVLTAKLVQLRDVGGRPANPGAPVKPGDTVFLRSGWHGFIRIARGYNDQFITLCTEPGQHPQVRGAAPNGKPAAARNEVDGGEVILRSGGRHCFESTPFVRFHLARLVDRARNCLQRAGISLPYAAKAAAMPAFAASLPAAYGVQIQYRWDARPMGADYRLWLAVRRAWKSVAGSMGREPNRPGALYEICTRSIPQRFP